MTVAIIDYGSGNLHSAAKAFERAIAECGLDQPITVTADSGALARASHIVLPGVGAFGDCLRGLRRLPGMLEALEEQVIDGGKPFLGICVGMQLMARRAFEHGEHEGLGWIDGEVRPIAPADPNLKIPHMGWNDLEVEGGGHPVLAGLPSGTDVYFVHGYHMVCEDEGEVLARTEYGGPVTAAVGRDNMVGTQFHPEKSQAAGLKLIANFLEWRP
ncbi:MAG: imidazole glycerol phosphate synthase subunit HisH [Alphaproteobacteria bacterium]